MTTRSEMRQHDSNTCTAEGSLADAAGYLAQLLQQYPRVAVTGRPGIGKSAVVDKLPYAPAALPVLRTDIFKHLHWDEQSNATTAWARARDRWLMEGVTVARALRHGLRPSAVLILTGMPLKMQNTIATMRLGDSVYKWCEEARSSWPDVSWHYWRVAEPKRC